MRGGTKVGQSSEIDLTKFMQASYDSESLVKASFIVSIVKF